MAVSAHADGGGSRLVLISGRDPLRGGSGYASYIVAQARTAILAGYEPHIFSVAGRTETLATEFGWLHRVRSPVRPPRSLTSVFQRPWLVGPICRLLADAPGPHLVHAFGAWADIAVQVAGRVGRRGVRAVPVATCFTTIEDESRSKLGDEAVRRNPWWWAVHQAEVAWVRAVTAPVEARAYRRCAVVVVNYENVARMLETHYGPDLPVRRMTYSPPTAFADPPPAAPPPDELAALGDPGAPLIVSVSRHDGRKGLDLLIESLADLRTAGVRFRACLVGPGLLLRSHRALIHSRGLADCVVAPGRVPDVTPFLQHADVYVLPSRQEGSGSVSVLEAMQCGACILCADIDGLPEDLTDGRDAVLFAGGDRTALATALGRLLSDPAARARLGAEARRTYERRFAVSASAAEIAALYTELGLAPATRTAPAPDSMSAAVSPGPDGR
jgi:glycosyltransferase involved in cell wall biosynthesis